MAGIKYIGWADEPHFTLRGMVEALREGHAQPVTGTTDMLTPMEGGEILTRAAAIADVGAGTKTVTIRPKNPQGTPPFPTVQGVFVLFDPDSGEPRAVINGALLTKWKTVADSILGASLLAPRHVRSLAVIGTGPMATSLAEAYAQTYETLSAIRVWGRTKANAEQLALRFGERAMPVDSIRAAVSGSDIVVSATAARSPIISGKWIEPGTHIDLVGAHGPNMREADDELIKKSSLFVDCRETVIDHIGELIEPIASGAIVREHVRGDLYTLLGAPPYARRVDEITAFKNGGGAHLDVMAANYMIGEVSE